MAKKIYVINARGEREPFSFNKVYQSARRVGASDALAQDIAQDIERKAFDGMRTSDIFSQVRAALNKERPAWAIRFNLKEAMRKLGPTGFPFEAFVGNIFSALGFEVKLNQFLKGGCLIYEIDFIAQDKKVIKIGECKFHNQKDHTVNTHIVLEAYAKFLDLKQGFLKNEKRESSFVIATNTKFTDRAKKYAKHNNLQLLGWRYPREEGLEKIIEKEKLYPVTILPSLNKPLARYFCDRQTMLVQDVLNIQFQNSFNQRGIQKTQLDKLKKEAELLLAA